ncbi:MAG: OadG family protein [Clostridia bacterium]|nr:OadG family protein [Clostridia bacterium]
MDLTNPTIGQAAAIAAVGICFVFAVLLLLLIIVKLFSSIFAGVKKNEKAVAPAAPVVAAPAAPKALAKGSCGDFKMHDVEPRVAAMAMAIVADELQTPLNELRFKSIKKVESEEK